MRTILLLLVMGLVMPGLLPELGAAGRPKRPADKKQKRYGKKGKGTVLKTQHGKLEVFPKDNAWNLDISKLKVHEKSDTWIAAIGKDKGLWADMATQVKYGIPYVVEKNPGEVEVTLQYKSQSTPGPYRIPLDAPIEAGNDAHVIVIDYKRKKLHELFHAKVQGKGWKAVSGVIWDLTKNERRPKGWTSADAAGLPIFPGLLKYEEIVEQKELTHALRFTAPKTGKGFIFPATHQAGRGSTDDLPPMGLRFRLKKDFDTKNFTPTAQIILKGLKKYGLILADNGSSWYVSGTSHPNWNMRVLRELGRIKGHHLEAVYTGPIER